MKPKNARVTILFCGLLAVFCMFVAPAVHAVVSVPVGKIPADTSLLWSPGRMALDNESALYVVDSYKNRVQKFDSAGNYSGTIEIARPSAVAVAPDGTIYIGSHRDFSVAVYQNGKCTGYLGTGGNEFSSIRDLAVDAITGDIYVVDNVKNEVKVYYSSGVPKGRLSGFNLPAGVAVTADGVYVLDAPVIAPHGGSGQGTGSRISLFNKSGMFQRSIDEYNGDGGQMARPTGIAVDRFGNIYVSDAARRSVLVYGGTGAYIGALVSATNDLNTAVSLALTRDDRLYVSSSETHSIVEIGLGRTIYSGTAVSLDFKSNTGDGLTPAALGY